MKKQDFDIQTELFPGEADTKIAEKIFLTFKKKNLTLAVSPGSVWNTKRWREEHFKTLSEKLVKNSFNLIFTGSKGERALCERILPVTNAVNTAGDLSILESAAVIKKCDLMICNDSGALHIANAVQTDVFSVFGPTVKNIGYFPFRGRDKVFEKDMPCRPCGSHGGDKCPLEHHDCMKKIYPDHIFEAILNRKNELNA